MHPICRLFEVFQSTFINNALLAVLIFSQKYAFWYRVAGITLGSLMCTTAASAITVTGGGFLAAVILSFVASTCWRILTVRFDVS